MTTDPDAEIGRDAGIEVKVDVQGQNVSICCEAHAVACQEGVAGRRHHHVLVTLQLTAHRPLDSDT